tara:strand:- start:409 stop:570 length:162 start_codon:yes stop_codon:yes gene_type:complete
MIRVKMFLTVSIDPDEYPIPADGEVGEELQDTIEQYLYDIDGLTIRNIKTVTE